MKYHFSIHREKSGYWANCIELKGCVTQANDLKQLKKNMEEALNLFLAEPPDSKLLFPLPKKRVKGNRAEVRVAPNVALALMLRHIRLERKLTQSEAAKLIGCKGLYSYQRLESGKTANPEFKTLTKIKEAFPELSIDELIAA